MNSRQTKTAVQTETSVKINRNNFTVFFTFHFTCFSLFSVFVHEDLFYSAMWKIKRKYPMSVFSVRSC